MLKKTAVIIGALAMMCSMNICAEEIETEKKDRSENYFDIIEFQIDSSVLKLGRTNVELAGKAILHNDTTMICLSDVAGYFEAEVAVSEDSVVITQGDLVVTTAVDSDKAQIEYEKNTDLNKEIVFPEKVAVVDEMVYVPLRALIEEVFAGEVEWNEATRSIYVSRPYQTKSIIASLKGDQAVIDAVECEEKKNVFSNVWELTFEGYTPDIVVKYHCDKLDADENIEYAEPNVAVFAEESVF